MAVKVRKLRVRAILSYHKLGFATDNSYIIKLKNPKGNLLSLCQNQSDAHFRVRKPLLYSIGKLVLAIR